METSTLKKDELRRVQALTNMPRCDELMLEGLMFPHRSPEKGLCWSDLEVGPDLAQGAYLAPVGDAGRAVYLACGAHVVSSMDAEISRCEIRDRADEFEGLARQQDSDGGLLAVGMKQCDGAGCIEGLIMSLPPIVVGLGQISMGFNKFIRAAGYAYRPEFDCGAIFTASQDRTLC